MHTRLIKGIEVLLAITTIVLATLWIVYPERPWYEPIILLITTMTTLGLDIVRRRSSTDTAPLNPASHPPQLGVGNATPGIVEAPANAQSKFNVTFSDSVTGVQIGDSNVQNINEPKQ